MSAFAFGRGKCLGCGAFLIGALDPNGELRCAKCTEQQSYEESRTEDEYDVEK